MAIAFIRLFGRKGNFFPISLRCDTFDAILETNSIINTNNKLIIFYKAIYKLELVIITIVFLLRYLTYTVHQ